MVTPSLVAHSTPFVILWTVVETEHKHCKVTRVDKNEVVLRDTNSDEEVVVKKKLLGSKAQYYVEGARARVYIKDGTTPLFVVPPVKVKLRVKQIASRHEMINKVLLENGVSLTVPEHIEVNDIIVVNVDKEQYVSKAEEEEDDEDEEE